MSFNNENINNEDQTASKDKLLSYDIMKKLMGENTIKDEIYKIISRGYGIEIIYY